MPTFSDLMQALSRLGLGRIITVGFGLCCLVIVNLFRSSPTVDTISNLVFGGLIAIAVFLPGKKEQ